MATDFWGASPDDSPDAWRRGWVSAGAIIATIALILLIFVVNLSNRAREQALGWERHAYDVMLLAQTVDATIARSEAALGRYVLDEEQSTGTIYYNEWRRAGRQIAQLERLVRDPEQEKLIRDLRRLYDARGSELAAAASGAASRQASGGVPFFYQAGMSETGPELRAKLEAIAARERITLRHRMEQTSTFGQRADRFTEWLAWLGILIGVAAIGLGLMAYRALAERLIARREADTEAWRAMSLEQAVQERTRELRESNARLQAEAAERESAEAQLRQVQKMEAVGQLTGGIAHDFNNMLAVIVGGLDLAKRKLDRPDQDVEFHLSNAMEGATRAAALTRRLLAFARSEPLLPQAVAPSELVESMLDLIDRSIGERITVQTRFAPEVWRVWADTNQLENAILNLCVNARDAMNGEGQLTIAIDNVSVDREPLGDLAPGDYVRISVSDTGVGISTENLERVFEPFFTTKPVGKGTGLGLSQIFGFARQSGGDIMIDSTTGVGTTVSLYVPRSMRTAGEAVHSAPVVAFEQRESAASRPGATVLVVEDDPRVSRSTVNALEELGYRPSACGSGAEALDILAASPNIELVVSDVMMPEMTGPELVRIISERYPDVAVLFVTGYVGEAGEAEDLAGYDILRKPFTVASLAAAVETTLARRFSGWPPASTNEAAE